MRLELEQLGHEEDRIVFLANVWLDKGETFESLHTLFSGENALVMYVWKIPYMYIYIYVWKIPSCEKHQRLTTLLT